MKKIMPVLGAFMNDKETKVKNRVFRPTEGKEYNVSLIS